MQNKQKLGYMALGAGILALGIIIGQWVTPDIEAQNNGVFDKITCRELEVVDKDGKKAIVLQSSEEGVSRIVVYESQNNRANVAGITMAVADYANQVIIADKTHNGEGIWLNSWTATGPMNWVKVYPPGKEGGQVQLLAADEYSGVYIKQGGISLESTDKKNLISIDDVKASKQAAFQIVSKEDGNYSSRWIRGRGRWANW